MKKFLILGASGLLGSRLMQLFPNSFGTYFANKKVESHRINFLDLHDIESFRYMLKNIKPDCVINCSGFTNVDLCERLPEKCWKLNCWSPFMIAQECSNRSIKLIHVSTDHFLNSTEIKLKETDVVKPSNQYGFAKLNAEYLVRTAMDNAIVVRSNFFHFDISLHRTFLNDLIKKIKNNEKAYSFSDVFFTPVSTNFLATSLNQLIDIDFTGIINIAGSETLSKFEFHNLVLKEMKISTNLHLPVRLNSINLIAPRPQFMALDNGKLQKLLRLNVPSIYDMIQGELALSK